MKNNEQKKKNQGSASSDHWQEMAIEEFQNVNDLLFDNDQDEYLTPLFSCRISIEMKILYHQVRLHKTKKKGRRRNRHPICLKMRSKENRKYTLKKDNECQV